MRARSSNSGGGTTTRNVHTRRWATGRRRSLQQNGRASTEREWGKGPQTPAPCPTPPSPLRSQRCGANKTRRKSHYPWTKNGGQVKKMPHPDTAALFSRIKSLYFINLPEALRRVEPSLVTDMMLRSEERRVGKECRSR